MHNKFKKAIMAVLSTTLAVTIVAGPLVANANAVAQPTVTVKEYDMDDYLDMLWETNQYERYEKFAAIASPEAWEKHIAKRDAVIQAIDPVEVVMANADWLGFDVEKDIFEFIRIGDGQAKVKVMHGDKSYIVILLSDDYVTWEIENIYRIK